MMPITGSFFEFRHHSALEGKYYNPALRSFSREQWQTMLRDMKAAGMDTIVLMCSSIMYPDECESYAPVDVFPKAQMACDNPLDVMMDTAEELGLSVFLSAGFYGVWLNPLENMQDPEVEKRAFAACREMYDRYHGYRCFAGWYLPDETEAGPYFHPVFMEYVRRYSTFFRNLDPSKKILVAPYGTNKIRTDDVFVEQLRQLDVDYVAYQDEVGVQKSAPEETGTYYAALRQAHDRAGKSRLWADMEIFRFEGQVYHSALLPADMERIAKQIRSLSPHVEKILVYAYPGMMSRPGSSANYGTKSPEKLYKDYMEWKKQHLET